MVAYTTTYNLAKPTVGDDEDLWGGYLNGNFDTLESLLNGTTYLTSLSLSGDITFGDNDKAIFGAGSDLQIYHDGSHSYVTDAGTGSLYIQGQGNIELQNSAGTETYALFVNNGKSELYYDNAAKLATTSTGIDVTGNVAVSGTVDGVDIATFKTSYDSHTHDFNNLTSKTSGTGEYSTSSHLVSGRGSGGVALTINDGYGNANVTFNHKSGTPEQNGNAARIEVNTDNSTGANMNFEVKSGVTSGTAIQTTSILNLSETQVTAYKPLDVTGAITASGAITSGGNTVLTTADYDVQVCHLKTNVNSSVTQGVANEFTVNFNLEEHNDTSTFSHSSGVVTVATAGWYRIVANLVYQNAGASVRNTIRAYVKKNGTEVTSTATYDYDRGTSYGEFSNNKINTMLYLAANDTIEIANYGQNIDGSVTIQSEECEFMVSSETVQASSTNADTVDGLHASSFALKEADADLDMNNFDIYGVDQIFHHGDTNTYIQFHASDQFRVVTGGSERFEVNNTRTQADRLLVTGGLYEDYDGLSGTTPSVDVDQGGGFSLTMTGNTTFTFAGAAIGASTAGFVIELTGNGGTVTWPSSVKWAGGTAPDAPASGETDLYVFYTRDGGSNWYGIHSIDAAA